MAKTSTLPPIVQQTLESIRDPKTPEHIRFNYVRTAENIRDCCDLVLKEYEKQQLKTRR